MTAVHQLLPRLAPRDAIGGHTLRVQEALVAAGITSEIYVGEVDPELKGRARHYSELTGARDGEPTWLLYHASIGGALGDVVLHRPEPLIVDYHNVTPPEYFEAWQPEVSVLLAAGRRQLAALAGRAVLGIADSAFNEGELRGVGFGRTAVVPVLLDLGGLVGSSMWGFWRGCRVCRGRVGCLWGGWRRTRRSMIW
ncbi:MAG: hypothetical protein M5U31_15900 [Acidimicrobiia bacterium]|nr:hypothetical protein [Acidimicrobiia bacterium]